jgi:adenine-specific DNA-methyltransferase
MLSVAIRVCRWADAQRCEPLAEHLVPGANEVERSRLRALGAVVGALASPGRARWPMEVDQWAGDGPAPPSDLVTIVREAMGSEDDALAAIYERAVRPRHRRRLGTFFTSPVLVEHMLDGGERLAGGAPDVVIDPGAGVGAFSLAAARRWPDARIMAVDVNVVTLGLLALRLDYEGLSDRADLILGDFLAWLQTAERDPDSVWLTVGNPPFTRSQSLDAATKREAADAAGEMVASGHATLSTLFAAAVARRLRPQDAMTLVLPAAWTYTRSARELRAGLWDDRHRPLELHRWPTNSRAFTGPDVTATVIGLGSERDSDEPFLHGVASVSDGRVVISGQHAVHRSGPCPDPLPGGAGRRVAVTPPKSIPLGEILRPRRGIATGANHFFFLTQRQALGLPSGTTRRGLCTLRGTPMDRVALDDRAWASLADDDARCFLLDLDEQRAQHPKVVALLEAGRAEGLPDRYLCRQREPWYCLEQIEPPDIILSPLVTSQGLRAVINSAESIPSNSLYGLYREDGVEQAVVGRVFEWLVSDAGVNVLRGHGRHFSGGSIKLEPGELRTLPVPVEIVAKPAESSFADAAADTHELLAA